MDDLGVPPFEETSILLGRIISPGFTWCFTVRHFSMGSWAKKHWRQRILSATHCPNWWNEFLIVNKPESLIETTLTTQTQSNVAKKCQENMGNMGSMGYWWILAFKSPSQQVRGYKPHRSLPAQLIDVDSDPHSNLHHQLGAWVAWVRGYVLFRYQVDSEEWIHVVRLLSEE